MKKIFFLAIIVTACSSSQKAGLTSELPSCIKKKIEAYAKLPQHEQPQNVIEYEYKGKKVYYVTMPCCDFFNEVYDSNCKLLGHPDGGFTGKGDGKLPDFTAEKKKEKIVWEKPKAN
jgi:hypothetical protein